MGSCSVTASQDKILTIWPLASATIPIDIVFEDLEGIPGLEYVRKPEQYSQKKYTCNITTGMSEAELQRRILRESARTIPFFSSRIDHPVSDLIITVLHCI
jgi:hypothetical protein